MGLTFPFSATYAIIDSGKGEKWTKSTPLGMYPYKS